MVARGEIWWHEDPAEGRRPYLVLTRTEAVEVMEKLLGVPATRTARGIPTEVALDEHDGMPSPCVLTLDNVTPVRRSMLTQRITVLGPEKMFEVCAALRHATVC